MRSRAEVFVLHQTYRHQPPAGQEELLQEHTWVNRMFLWGGSSPYDYGWPFKKLSCAICCGFLFLTCFIFTRKKNTSHQSLYINMRRGRNQPSPSISSIDSQEELSSGDDMEDELDDTLNPDVDELDDDLDDDLDNMIEDTLDVQSPSPEDTRKRSNKRKKPVYEEFGSDDEEEDYEVVTNRPMTKRQRAKMNNEGPEEFLELPMDTGKKKNILTQEEQTLRRSEVARRRKNQSIQRAEKDKEDTINRLLKKQASKSRKIIKDDGTDEKDGKTSSRPTQPDSLRYTSTREGNLLMIPTTVKLEDVFGQIAREPRQKTIPICAVKGCGQTKKYTGIKSGKAACSLEHYKKVEVGGK